MSNLYLTRLIIETTSPMAINTGGRETGFDSQLARDVNNLPYIPATSIAGVWQHLAKNEQGISDSTLAQWFGFTQGKQSTNGKSSQASTFTLYDGVVHNSQNKPVQGFLTPEQINQDSLLSLLVQVRPHYRDRVSINDRGIARDTGKFDQLLLPAGVRFCIDIKFSDERFTDKTTEEITLEWQQLLQCWQHPLFTFGSSTRNGLGKIKVVASEQHIINLHGNPKASIELTRFAQRENIPEKITLPNKAPSKTFAELPLKALDNWRCGTGTQLLGTIAGKPAPEHSVGMISYSESKVVWHNNQAELSKPQAVLCGSSIKGILAHRIAFHYRKHTEQWAETLSEADHDTWQQRPEGLKELLGFADDSEHSNSQAGKLFVEDCPLYYQHTVIRHHNSIDRFTGGVRQGALFSEELLYQPTFTLKLRLQTGTTLNKHLQAALSDTLNDLKAGLLPMGAGSGRGTSLVMADDSKPWQVNMQQIIQQGESA